MKENMIEKKKISARSTRERKLYMRPCTEVYSSEPGALLAGTYFGGDAGGGVFGNYVGGNPGSASFGNSLSSGGSAGGFSFGNAFSGGASPNGGDAGAVTFSTDAKGFSIGFSDVWE